MGTRKTLGEKELLFVTEFMLNGNNGSAAFGHVWADVDQRHWSRKASTLLKKDHFQQELKRRRDDVRRKTEYGVAEAIEELNDAIKFAKTTKNATALVRALELKGKIAGLYVDKVEHSTAKGFQIQLGGMAAPAYARELEMKVDPEIEVESEVKDHIDVEKIKEDSKLDRATSIEDLLK